MKYAMVIPAGAADEPVAQLDGATPLAAARTPNLDYLATHGRQGCVHTVPPKLEPDTDVATLALMGYDPRREYPGRGPLEAAAFDLPLEADQVVLSSSFVTIVDGICEDFTAGNLAQPEARQLIAELNAQVAKERCTFHSGESYRHLITVGCPADFSPVCTPPRQVLGKRVTAHLPRGPGADWLRTVMELAATLLKDHEVNLVRRDLGENPATGIWPWGLGRVRTLQPFAARFQTSAALIAAEPAVRGIGTLLGLTPVSARGATGDLHTNYSAKGKAAVKALKKHDLVIVHVAAPAAASLAGDVDAKVKALEQIDSQIIGPLLEALRTGPDWRLLVAPDHTWSVVDGAPRRTPPPFCLAGRAIHSVLERPLTEASAAASDLQIELGHELMEYFLRP